MTSAIIAIRRARPDETARLQAIERDAALGFLELGGYAFCPGLGVRGIAEHERAQRAGVVLVAAGPDDRPLGFALVVPVDAAAHLLELDVARNCQRRGIGRRLVAAVEAWACDAGYPEVTLTTFRDVPWNAPAYARMGYRVFRPRPERAGLRGILAEERATGVARAPRVAMRKPLAATGVEPAANAP